MLLLFFCFICLSFYNGNIVLVWLLSGGIIALSYIKIFKSIPYMESTPAPRVLFFPDPKLPCKSYIDSFASSRAKCNRRCKSFHREDVKKSSLVYILERLRCAKKIDLCMYRFTLEEASDVLIILKNKGVKIRVIADTVTEDLRNDRIPAVKAAGIEVREMYHDSNLNDRERPLMHNKFVIIDRKSCFAGSFNWTWRALMKNEEMVIEIHNRNVVKPIVERFEKMWARYAPRNGGLPNYLTW